MTDYREAPEDPDKLAANRLRQPSGSVDDHMTEGQREYLARLCQETGEPFDDGLSIAEASRRIEELEQRAPRPS